MFEDVLSQFIIIMIFSGIFLGAYLVGSIPFGLILTRLFGYGDIRKIGSGNIGATNVLRTGNKFLAFLTLILDAGKAGLLIWVIAGGELGRLTWEVVAPGMSYEGSCFTTDPNGNALEVSCGFKKPSTEVLDMSMLMTFAAMLGHCFPVWLKFKGGKGVATSLGALLVTVPLVGLATCLTWLITAFIFRMSSLSALIALGITPFLTYLIYFQSWEATLFNTLLVLVVFYRHKENIHRILKGTEPKIGQKKDS